MPTASIVLFDDYGDVDQLRPPIRGRYPLSRAAEALARGRAGQLGGKLLLIPD